jgi:thiamine biosynthesis lipoprotein
VKATRLLMGMPVTLEVVDDAATQAFLDSVFAYFEYVDETFSTYKEQSEISRLNRGELKLQDASPDMRAIFDLAEQTRQETNGYFDVRRNGIVDPSGIVKGWAIQNAAELIARAGFENFYVDAGGDVQTRGKNSKGEKWRVGIRNPFAFDEIVKVFALSDCGIATSGSYIRGAHIYNPKKENDPLDEIVSLTVIAPRVYDADRFATAAFAMGRAGIEFIAQHAGWEAYMIDCNKRATFTRGLQKYAA